MVEALCHKTLLQENEFSIKKAQENLNSIDKLLYNGYTDDLSTKIPNLFKENQNQKCQLILRVFPESEIIDSPIEQKIEKLTNLIASSLSALLTFKNDKENYKTWLNSDLIKKSCSISTTDAESDTNRMMKNSKKIKKHEKQQIFQ